MPLQNGQYIEVVCPLDHPSQDGKAVAAIEKITIADTDQLGDSWFKTEILDGLNGADIEFIDPSTNDGEHGIVAVHLTTPSGLVRLDWIANPFLTNPKSLFENLHNQLLLPYCGFYIIV
jgi:hypothetical protein